MSGQKKCSISLVFRIQCVWWSTIRSRFSYRIVEHVQDHLLAAMLTENYIWLFQWVVACLLLTCSVSGFGQALRCREWRRPRPTPKHPAVREKKPLVLRVETLGKSWNLRTWFSRPGKSWNLKIKMWKCRRWTLNLSSWKGGKLLGKSRGKWWNLKNVKDYEPLTTSSVSAFLRNLYFSDYLANKSKQLP